MERESISLLSLMKTERIKGNDGRAARYRTAKRWLIVVGIFASLILVAFLIALCFKGTKRKNAYVFYATTSDYACGAFVAIASLQESGTPADGNIDFVLLTFGEASNDFLVKEQAAKMNVKIKKVKHMKAFRGSNPYYLNVMVKLRVFELYEYDRVIFLESDMMIKENLDHLFALLPDNKQLAAPHVMIDTSTNKNQFGSYLMVIKPSKRLWSRIIGYYDDNGNLKQDLYDMDLLNQEFSSEVHLLPGIYGMLTAGWDGATDSNFQQNGQEWYEKFFGTNITFKINSDKVFSSTKVLHFTPNKPMIERSLDNIKRNRPNADPRYYATFERWFTLASYVCPARTIKSNNRYTERYKASSYYSDYFY